MQFRRLLDRSMGSSRIITLLIFRTLSFLAAIFIADMAAEEGAYFHGVLSRSAQTKDTVHPKEFQN